MAQGVMKKATAHGRQILSFDGIGALFLFLVVAGLFVVAVVGVSYPESAAAQSISRGSLFLMVVALMGIVRNGMTRASLLRQFEGRGTSAGKAARSFKDSVARLDETRRN